MRALSTFGTISTFQKKSYQPHFAKSKPVAHQLSLEELIELETGQLEGVVLTVNVVVMMIRKPVHLVNSNHLSAEVVKEDMEETDLHMKVEALAEVEVVVVTGETVEKGERVEVLEGRGEKVEGLEERGGKVEVLEERGGKVEVLEEVLEEREGRVEVLVTGKVVVLVVVVVEEAEGLPHLSKQQRLEGNLNRPHYRKRSSI